MTPTKSNRHVAFGTLVATSVVCLLMAKSGAMPRPAGVVVAGGVLLGWLAFGVIALCRRTGRLGIVAVCLFCSVAAIWGWTRYQDELVIQRNVAEIKRLGDVSVITHGSLRSNHIEYLYFDSHITESQVLKILSLPGLEKLDRVVFKLTPISDATLKRLSEISSLQSVYVEGAEVTAAGVEQLSRSLPKCSVQCVD